MRGRLPSLTGSVLDGFIHNGLTFASSRFKYKPDMPMSEVAYMNRQSVQSIFTTGEADINLAIAREMTRRKQGIFICEMFEQAYSVTSWSAAWKGLDLTNAVEPKEREKHAQQGTKPEVFILGRGGERDIPRRCTSPTFFFRSLLQRDNLKPQLTLLSSQHDGHVPKRRGILARHWLFQEEHGGHPGVSGRGPLVGGNLIR